MASQIWKILEPLNDYIYIFSSRKRREKEKSSVMTMIYKTAPPGHHTRCPDDDVILAVEKPTGQLVHFQNTEQEKKYHIPVVSL